MRIQEKTSDIKNLPKSVSEGSAINVIIFGLVLYKEYLNMKVRSANNILRHYYKNRMLTFLKHDNMKLTVTSLVYT